MLSFTVISYKQCSPGQSYYRLVLCPSRNIVLLSHNTCTNIQCSGHNYHGSISSTCWLCV